MTAGLAPTPAEVFGRYAIWLDRQPLAVNTCLTYRRQVQRFCAWLATATLEDGDPLRDPPARDAAVRAYTAYLKTARTAKPTSVNLTLAAIDHFYRFLGMDRPRVMREALPVAPPRALDQDEQQRLLHAVERTPLSRDRALALLLFYTGLRIGECAALNVADVVLSAGHGTVIVRQGDDDRVVPLNAALRASLARWLTDRAAYPAATLEPALFLSRHGRRLAARTIDLIIRQLGERADVALPAHTLRHTCLTNLVRTGDDLVRVAEIAGHKRLETTRRYSVLRERDGQPPG